MNDQAFQTYKRKAEKTWNRIFLPFENGVAGEKRMELKTKQEKGSSQEPKSQPLLNYTQSETFLDVFLRNEIRNKNDQSNSIQVITTTWLFRSRK